MLNSSQNNIDAHFGSVRNRTVQLGFPVELTSDWDADDGYSWKRLTMDGVSVTDPSLQETGNKAVTPDNDETLTSGKRGWLEPDPGAAGYVFIPIAESSSVSAWKEPVRCATTAAGTLATSFENGDSVDGVTLATGDRILVKNQASASENGIYTVNASGAPTRATDADSGAELLGATVAVTNGTTNADTVWLCTANATISVGVTSLPWVKLGPAVTISGSGTDNRAVRWDGTSAIQDSRLTIADDGSLSTFANAASAISFYLYDSGQVGHALIYYSDTLGQISWYFDDTPDTAKVSADVSTGDMTIQPPSDTGRLKLSYPVSGATPKYAIEHNLVTYDGVTTTCTVQVGGVDKTMTITGGIVTDIS